MKNYLPLVTIVTVVFNDVDKLEQTIKSIIKQDYQNFEYIIIDGESEIDTIQIINKYEEHISYWKSEPDEGIYDAMNKGIIQASGEWINFMNAGDTFTSNKVISDVIKNLKKDTDIVVGGINTLSSIMDIVERKQFEGIEKIWKYNPCYHQAAFVRLKLMKQYMFDTSYKILSDYDFMFKCYVAGYRFQGINTTIANYLLGGISNKNKTLTAIEGMSILVKYSDDPDVIYESRWFVFLKNPHLEDLSSQLYQNYVEQIKKINEKNKKIAIYGYGLAGKLAEKILGDKVIIIVDKHLNEEGVVHPEMLSTINFDYVFIAVIGRELEIEKYLMRELKIVPEKILAYSLEFKMA